MLGGGLFDYILFGSIGPGFVFWLLAIPVSLLALALAFLKIQEQPLIHFVKAGMVYLSRPKLMLWKRHGQMETILVSPPPEKKPLETLPLKKRLQKSELEQLAYNLDTDITRQAQKKSFGQITSAFEKIIAEDPNVVKQPVQQQK